MTTRSTILGAILCGCSLSATAGDWLQFRGTASNSVAFDNLPIDIASDDSIAWTATLPGRGPSSPIVVGNRVWDYIANPDNALHYMSGVTRWEVEGDRRIAIARLVRGLAVSASTT